jgi:probable F420-dependent oxidoreductase
MQTMKFAVGLTVHHPMPESLCSGSFLRDLGQLAEGVGFDAVFFTEHPVPSDDWLASGGHDALDPFVALSFLAAATSRLRLLTNLTVLPYRNPFLLAKAVSTLDRVSNGRVTLGAGVGYLEGEYAALGVDFDERNTLFDESLETLRSVWTGRSVAASGLHFSAAGNTSLPTPVQDPVPIWLGGNSKLTLRRVARAAQGWMPLPNPRSMGSRRRSRHLDDLGDLERYIAELQAECEAVGRTDVIDIVYMALAGGSPTSESFDADAHRAQLAEQADLGVTWNITSISGGDPSDVLDAIERYARLVIHGD